MDYHFKALIFEHLEFFYQIIILHLVFHFELVFHLKLVHLKEI